MSADLQKEVYDHTTQGLKCNLNATPAWKLVYRLRKPLYNSRQNDKLWHNSFFDCLTELRLENNHVAPSTFTILDKKDFVCAIIATLVDDFLIIADSEQEVRTVVGLLITKYAIKTITPDHTDKQKFLGTYVEVERGEDN